MEAGKDDETTSIPQQKPARKSRGKKVKVEDTPEAQMIEPKSNGLDGRMSRVARNARKMRADHLKLEHDAEAKPDEQALKAGRVDGTADSTVKAEPGRVTKPAAKKGRPRKGVKIEDADHEAEAEAADVPVEPESEPAPESEEETPKPKAGRKKGTAKPIARGRPSESFLLPLVPPPIQVDTVLTRPTPNRTEILDAFMLEVGHGVNSLHSTPYPVQVQ